MKCFSAVALISGIMWVSVCCSAYAAPSPDAALEQKALTDVIGKPIMGYFYTTKRVRYRNYGSSKIFTKIEKLVWTPMGVVKTNIGGVENDVVFLKGYDQYTLGKNLPDSVDGVLDREPLSGGGPVKAAVYKISNGEPVLAGKPSDVGSFAERQSGMSIDPSGVTVHNLGNGYIGIFISRSEMEQGVGETHDDIYVLKDGVLTNGGSIPVSGDNEGAFGKNSPSFFSYTTKMSFGDAGPGQPYAIILHFKSENTKALNKTAVYTDFLGDGYHGFDPMR